MSEPDRVEIAEAALPVDMEPPHLPPGTVSMAAGLSPRPGRLRQFLSGIALLASVAAHAGIVYVVADRLAPAGIEAGIEVVNVAIVEEAPARPDHVVAAPGNADELVEAIEDESPIAEVEEDVAPATEVEPTPNPPAEEQRAEAAPDLIEPTDTVEHHLDAEPEPADDRVADAALDEAMPVEDVPLAEAAGVDAGETAHIVDEDPTGRVSAEAVDPAPDAAVAEPPLPEVAPAAAPPALDPMKELPPPDVGVLALLAVPPGIVPPDVEPTWVEPPTPDAAMLALLAEPPAVPRPDLWIDEVSFVPAPRPTAPTPRQNEASPREPPPRQAAKPAPAEKQRKRTVRRETPEARAAKPAAPESAARTPGREAAPATAAGRRDYGRRVAGHVERFKRYPAEAQRSGAAGVVRVAIGIDAAGRISAARVAGSSGHAVLDREAMATVRRAAPFPKPPQGVAPVNFTFTLRFSR